MFVKLIYSFVYLALSIDVQIDYHQFCAWGHHVLLW